MNMLDENKKKEEAFKKIQEAESEWIKQRRTIAKQEKGHPDKDAFGLALSGGGIRSATFNLGLLQALDQYVWIKRVDYLSTVSGGGYIGSCFTWLKTIFSKGKDRVGESIFGATREDYDKLGGKVLAWLRDHSKYLTPGNGLGAWALSAAVVTGTLVNLLVLLPIFLGLFWLLSRQTALFPPVLTPICRQVFPGWEGCQIIIWVLALGLSILVLFLLSSLLSALATRFRKCRQWAFQAWWSKCLGKFLQCGIFLVAVGSIPFVYTFLSSHLGGWLEAAMSGISVSGIMSMFGASRGRKAGNETRGFRSVFLSIGLSLIVYGLFLWFYHLGQAILPLTFVLAGLVISLLFAIFSDTNHVSMHRYYRNRLMQAYMPEKSDLEPDKTDVAKATYNPDEFLLKELFEMKNKHKVAITDSPYPIVNCNLQTVGSKQVKLRSRGGDNFIFSPLYCGSASTDYLDSDKYVGGQMNLATAFAISGAAVDPNSYATRSRPLSFLMTLLNVRLGYWIINPIFDKKIKHFFPRFVTAGRYLCLFSEMFGNGLNEEKRHIRLSDGGHFENLGLYELIRRRCGCIIVSDAGMDKDFAFQDLGKVSEMVRVDFGAKIEIDTRLLIPDQGTGQSTEGFARGKVTYSDKTTAELIYIKPTLLPGLPEDIYSYGKMHPDFPHQTTMDQFYDEGQFEAYRELGFRIGQRLCKKLKNFPAITKKN